MEIIRSYHVFEGQNSRFRKKNETKRIIGSKTKWFFNQSGSFTSLTGRGLYRRRPPVVPGTRGTVDRYETNFRTVLIPDSPVFSCGSRKSGDK